MPDRGTPRRASPGSGLADRGDHLCPGAAVPGQPGELTGIGAARIAEHQHQLAVGPRMARTVLRAVRRRRSRNPSGCGRRTAGKARESQRPGEPGADDSTGMPGLQAGRTPAGASVTWSVAVPAAVSTNGLAWPGHLPG